MVAAAVLAAEDRSFYTHIGIDLLALARAAWVVLREVAFKQGGSRITQQLIRQLALSPRRTFERKVKEGLAERVRMKICPGVHTDPLGEATMAPSAAF